MIWSGRTRRGQGTVILLCLSYSDKMGSSAQGDGGVGGEVVLDVHTDCLFS